MATPNVDKMSLKDLLELESKVQKAISAARDRERSEVKQALAQLAEKRGFSVNELFGGRGRGKSSAAKFVNPDNKAETWTGRVAGSMGCRCRSLLRAGTSHPMRPCRSTSPRTPTPGSRTWEITAAR